MTISVFISITGHMVVAVFITIVFCFSFHITLLPAKTSAGHGSLPIGVSQIFIPKGSH